MSNPVLSNLPIGSVVQVSDTKNTTKYMTRLVGVDPNKLIITALPSSKQLALNSSDYKGIFDNSKSLILRILGTGLVFGFTSRVIGQDSNNNLLICSYPDSIQTRNLRKETRYPCTLASTLELDEGPVNGLITNISANGCQFCVSSEKTDLEGRLKAYGQSRTLNINIHFPFNEKDTRISAVIKSVAQIDRAGLQVGMAFDDQTQGVKMFLDSLHLDAVSSFFSES